MSLNRLTLAFALSLLASHVTFGQNADASLAGVVGAPFSATRSQQAARNFADGNRIDRGASTRLYRDSQGRTRIEHDVPAQMLAADPRREPMTIMITDPVSSERYLLQPNAKTATVFKMDPLEERRPASESPAISVIWGGHLYGPTDSGWSKQESLGEQSIDGIRALGTRRQYTLSVGTVGNEKPIVLTVEQWYGPDLGLTLKRAARASTGAELNFEVENLVRAEPAAALFTIPAGYRRIDVGRPSPSAH